MASKAGIDGLPNHSTVNILSYLPSEDLLQASLVSSGLKDLSREDKIWRGLSHSTLPDPTVRYLERNAKVFEPRAGWRTVFARTRKMLRDIRNHNAAARHVSSPSVSSLGQGAVFGCSLYSSGVASTSAKSSSRPDVGDDLFMAATGSGTIAMVSSAGSSVDLNNPAYHGQGDGILGFDVDPRTGVAVAGTFGGGVHVLSVNYKEYHSLDTAPVRTLRKMLSRRGATAAGCIEKSDIVRRIKATGACPVIRQEASLPSHGATVVSTSIRGRMAATGSNDGTAKIIRLDPSVLYRFQDPPEEEAEEGDSAARGAAAGGGGGGGAGTKGAGGKPVPAAAGKKATVVRTIDPQTMAGAGRREAGGEAAAIDVVHLMSDSIYTGDKSSELRRYDLETGALLRQWDTGHGWVWSVCPTESTYREFQDIPEDSRVILTGGTDGVVRVWDSRVVNRYSHTEALAAGLERAASRPVSMLHLSSGGRAPVAGMQACWSRYTVYAGSFDGQLHVLDIRAPRHAVPSIADDWWGEGGAKAGAGGAATRGGGGGLGGGGVGAGSASAGGGGAGGLTAASAPAPTPALPSGDVSAAGGDFDVSLTPLYRLTGVPLPAATRQMLVQQLGVPNERLCRVAVSPRSVAVGSFDGRVHVFAYGQDLFSHSSLDEEAAERVKLADAATDE